MCGICGIVSFRNKKNTLAEVTSMVSSLTHRGPDAKNIVSLDNITLGHTRLSIIDISPKANQPLSDVSGRYWIVYNGEIYNYKSLRDELLKERIPFNTASDTEVILNGYIAWGVNVLDRLRGMFSFALWDTHKKELFIARDRIGEKPFVYAWHQDNFYFASEINALLACGIPKDIDQLGLLHFYGTMTSIPPPLTIYKHIKKLEQAHYIMLSKINFIKKKFWHIDYSSDKTIPPQTWIQRFRETLNDVVKLTLTSDVPLGLCLSGGVDSSAICALASEHNKKLQYFMLSSQSEDDPELKRAMMVAQRFSLPLQITKFPELDDYELVKTIPLHYGEPFSLYAHTYGTFFHDHISRHVKTVITGNGADEILYGYTMYNDILKSISYRLFSLCNKVIPCTTAMNYFYMYKNILNQSRLILNSDLLNKFSFSDIVNPFKHIYQNTSFREPISAKGHCDLLYYHYHSTVYYPDISSMHHSLELRSPYLDHKLIELIAQMPIFMLLRDANDPTHNKFILKKSMEDLLPKEILYSKKMGFGYGIDYHQAMRTFWKKEIENTLNKKRHRTADFIDNKKVQKAWNAFLSGDMNAGKIIFTTLSFLHWWDHYIS